MNGICKVSQFYQSVGFTNKDNNNGKPHGISKPPQGICIPVFQGNLYSSLEFSHSQSTICVCVAPFLPILVFLNQFYVCYLSVIWLNKETRKRQLRLTEMQGHHESHYCSVLAALANPHRA